MRVLSQLPIALAATLAVACVDPSSLFTGRWVAEEAHDGVIEGVPVLALGHYGLEVAGLAYFLVPGGITYEAACPCAFVNHRSNDPDAGTLAFETVCGDVAAAWRLKLVTDTDTDDAWLEGTVDRADGGVAGHVVVRLKREEAFVREEDKRCPPDPSR